MVFRRTGPGLSTTASIKDIGNKLKAGCSVRAITVRPGRDREPMLSEPTALSGRIRYSTEAFLFANPRPSR
jgi:hypothetical protein